MNNIPMKAWFWLFLIAISFPVCAHQGIADVLYSQAAISHKVEVNHAIQNTESLHIPVWDVQGKFLLQLDEKLQKIYVSPEEVVITPEAIFLLLSDGTLVQTLLVSIDAGGLYVIAAKYQCPACGWGNSDNICINRKCSLYGK